MEKKQTLSACLIVKNEEKLLEGCLESIKDIVDEIIVVDTGSNDGTIEIAKKYGARIFDYPWDGSFANARNYSIRQAACDWILLPDADERFIAEDKDKLFQFLRNEELDGAFFTIYNYVGEGGGTNYTLHNAFRLLRNNGLYEFWGEIHEQITRPDGNFQSNKFTVLNVRIKHLGYLDQVVAEKDKRKRNIPLLQKQLEDDPHNPFTLFNLGNEYMALKEYEKAYELYKESMDHYNKSEAFSPHLLFRSAMCLYTMKKFPEAIELAEKALKIYPRCTDFEYFKGLVYWDWKRYTKAIDSFNKAIEMGEPPKEIRFSDDCATVKPLYSLGKLYMYLNDYQRALDAFIKILNINSALFYVLYDIADILNMAFADKNVVEEKLTGYFGSLNHLPNLLILTDILIKIGLYDRAEKYIRIMREMDGYSKEKTFLEGKLLYHTGDFDGAEVLLKEVLEKEKVDCNIFPHFYTQCLRYLFAAALVRGETQDELLAVVPFCDQPTAAVYKQVAAVYSGSGENVLGGFEDVQKAVKVYEDLLSTVLKTKKFELFEKLLYAYNYFESDRVLFSLANIYLSNGYYQMAVDTVMRSIKELNVFDSEGAEILHRAYYCQGLS